MISLRQQLIAAARGTVLLKVIYLLATLAGSVVLARALGPAGYGIYALVLGIVSLLAIPSQAGLPALLIRETAKAHAAEDWARMKGLWGWSTRVIIATSIGIAAIVSAGMWVFAHRLDGALMATLVAGLVLVPLSALGNARGAVLRGLRLIVRGMLPESIVRPLVLVLLVSCVWWFSGSLSPATAMMWHVVAAAIAFVIGALILWRARPAEVKAARPDTSSAADWRRSVLPLAMITGLQMVNAQAGIVLLGMLRPEAEVGLYKVAASASALAVFGLQVANMVTAPHIARLHAVGNKAQLQRLASIGAAVSTALTIPVFLAFFFGGRFLIALLYGEDYEGAWVPLVILCAGQVVNAAFGSVGLLLSMTGHERDSARWLLAAAALNILACLVLVPFGGMTGAAIASMASVVFWNIAFRRAALRRINIDGTILSFLGRGIR